MGQVAVVLVLMVLILCDPAWPTGQTMEQRNRAVPISEFSRTLVLGLRFGTIVVGVGLLETIRFATYVRTMDGWMDKSAKGGESRVDDVWNIANGVG